VRKLSIKFYLFSFIFIIVAICSIAYVLTGQKWPVGTVVGYYINPNTNQVTDETSAVKNAANKWSQIFPAGLRLSYLGSTSVKDYGYNNLNTICWKNNGDNGYLAYAYWWYWLNNNNIHEADMVFNDYYTWSTSGNHYDIETVALHEFGHWVGLDHSKTGIMRANYSGIQRKIDSDARAGFMAMYRFEEEKPSIELDRYSLSFTGTEGLSSPPSQVFRIRNSGKEALNYQVSTNKSWISISPKSGSSTGEWDKITTSVNISRLGAGNYSGIVSVTSNNADNSPQNLSINLTVLKDQPPSVTIKNPKNGDFVKKIVTIKADASDDKGVTKVEFYIDNNLKSTDTISPYEWSWDTTKYASGSHSIKARAYDTINQTSEHIIQVTVDQPPNITITSPPSGSSVYGIVTIKIKVNDDFGISKVEFYINGKLSKTHKESPYTFNWGTNKILNGKYTIKAVVYDTRNQTAQNKIDLLRIPHPPLNFSGTKQNNSSVLLEEYINVLTWQSNKLNRGISKYRIYQQEGKNWILQGEVNADTFDYWHRNVSKDKKYSYALKAVDNQNNEGESTHARVE